MHNDPSISFSLLIFSFKCWLLFLCYFSFSFPFLSLRLFFFGIQKDTIWATQLLAVACFSLAAKMEEVTVPPLVDLQVNREKKKKNSSIFLHCYLNLIALGMWEHGQIGEEKFVFEGITIERMELVVLNHLKWKLRAYTPFSFLDYFIRKINDDQKLSSGSLISRSIQLIISTTRGISPLRVCSD